MDMPRPRPPYLQKETSRHGKVTWYVRKGDGPRIRIRGDFGSPEFTAAYQAAIHGTPVNDPAKHVKHEKETLGWLVDQYLKSMAWAAYAPSTREAFERILIGIVKDNIGVYCRDLVKKDIIAGIDRRKATPFAAVNFVKVLSGLFRWAVEAEHMDDNPCDGVKVKKPKTEGFAPWTQEDCARYEDRWPIGTRERLAYDLLLYTGLRRGDAVRLSRFHVRNGVATIKTEKTGTIVSIRLLPPLLRSIEAGPCGKSTFIAGEKGQRMVKESFGTWFRIACRAAEVTKSAHGLRKAGAERAAEAGATENELNALFGWKGGMSRLYTEKANREILATSASDKIELAMSGPDKIQQAQK